MDFCMQMVKQLMLEEMNESIPKNLILSPLSFNVFFNMVAAGTTGLTLERMLAIFQCKSIEEIHQKSSDIMAIANTSGTDGPIITSINAVWVDKHYPVKASYAELLKRIYDCEVNTNFDFDLEGGKVLNEINTWAETASRGLIKNLLKFWNPKTPFVRANALYFRGLWSEPFQETCTQTKEFFLLDGNTIQVPFLTSWKEYKYGSFEGYKILNVPYQSGPNTGFSMYFFLPDEKNGWLNLLEKFNSDSKHLFLEPVLQKTDLEIVQIPKFKFSYEVDPSDTMYSMGLQIPYQQNKLDYAEMIQVPEDLPSLTSTIIQKAYIEVDEKGTEASAVTIDDDMGCSLFDPPPRPKFVADHPFMFVIKEDKSRLVFFTGLVSNPLESND